MVMVAMVAAAARLCFLVVPLGYWVVPLGYWVVPLGLPNRRHPSALARDLCCNALKIRFVKFIDSRQSVNNIHVCSHIEDDMGVSWSSWAAAWLACHILVLHNAAWARSVPELLA